MYSLHLVFVVFWLLAAYVVSRKNILHPCFVFASLSCVLFFTDYLVTGFRSDTPFRMIQADASYYQTLFLFLSCSVMFFSIVFRKTIKRYKSTFKTIRISKFFANFAILLIVLEIVKRLIAVNFSLDEFFSYSFGPRFGRPWKRANQQIGDSRFLFELVGMFYPLAGVAFAYLLTISRKFASRVVFLSLMILVLILTVGDGSRTPVGLILFSLVGFVLTENRYSKKYKVLVATICLASAAVLFSVMVQYRFAGLSSIDKNSVELKYQFDDSYDRTLNAMYVADNQPYRWDGVVFSAVVLFNPIPRFFWPGKPLLDANYYGPYKPHWITITYVGELVAIFGVYLGLFFSFIYSLLVLYFLYAVYNLQKHRMGIIGYAVMTLYAYMCMRSALNVTQYIYLPLLAFLLVKISDKRIYYGNRRIF